MSSLSNEQPGSPFSEYSELCKVPSLSPTVPAQSWDWQHPSGMDMATPRGLVVGGGALAPTGLTDEDKLCFFEQPGRASMDVELKVPGKVGGISGSTSLGNTSLGSAGESPDSPLSSSPSPSPASPGRLPSVCGVTSRVSLPPVPGSPARHRELSSPSSAMPPHSMGASLMQASPVDGDSPSQPWNNSSFAESSPKVAMPQVAPNYCVIGVVKDKHLEKVDEVVAGAGAALGAQQLSEGSSGDNSEEEEMEEEELELEPCFMGRAQQQRKAMRRAMSECSHLSVPSSLELPDKYPGGDGAGLDQLVSPMGGPRRSPHSMKRSLTVAEDQPSTPPPTLSAAGTTHIDLRQAPPEPHLCLSPFLPLKDNNAGFPLSPLEAPLEGFKTEKEPGGIVLPVPPSPKGFSDMDTSPALFVGSDTEGETKSKSDMAKDAKSDQNGTKLNSSAAIDFGAGNKSAVAGNIDDDLCTGGYTNLGLNSSTNPFITVDVKSDTMEKAEKKEEKLEDNVKKADLLFDPLDKAEQKSVKVEFISSEAPAMVEKETEKGKQNEAQKEKEKEAEKAKEAEKEKEEKEANKVKETEKQAEKGEEKKEPEKGKETEKVESLQQKAEKEDKVEESPEKLVKTEKAEKEDKVKESPEKMVKTEKAEKVDMTEKVESKVEKTENVEKVDKNEKPKVEEAENKNNEMLEKTEVKDDKKQQIDNVEKTPEQQPTPVKLDMGYDKQEKKADTETKTTAEVEETKKEEADEDKAEKTKKEEEVEKPPEKPAEKTMQKSEKEEKQDKMHADKKVVEKKDDKKDKAAKVNGEEKAKKAKPATNGSSATPSKDLGTADKKTKPAAGAAKPTAAAKTRPSSAAAGGSALTKRPTPSTTTTSTSDKKPTTAKAPSTAAAGPKRPSTTSTSRPASSTTARDVKPKTTAEKRPLVPKASTATSNQTGSTAATKNGTATTAASKTATSGRTTASTRTSTATAAKKPLASKTDSKPGEEKKPGTPRTSTADATKPKTTAARSSASTTAASRTRTAAAKPATPSSTTGTVPEKKPPVPRAVRATSSTTSTTTTTTSRTTSRPNTAPAPDIRNARSKIGSTDNMKHQPGGGKVPSASQSRALASKETSQGKVHIVSKKVDFSHVTSRLGSKDNMKHVPGGGNVQILNKKVDLSKVTSKCGSKDNIKHKPGGGVVKIESHKVSFREKAQSKVGSMDNVSHSPGGGNIKAEGAQDTTEGNGTPLSGTAAPGSEPGQAGSPAAQENGLKEGAPCDSEGLREAQALDSCIPETSI
ncbi:microtubule-associated protein 4 isoform X12 [Dicentrarchus labrax]|uniref:microtubule-associated protein 4 isoform X12 n=1 Tax=Dicentrarchus labrax TaxID=13489 RepID=UPI0021F673A6|nr:microtubule-associated protein 4 isoform X12 [Dicentrarchus labrax]